MRSIAFVSEKGGAAKTTTALNLAYYLGSTGLRVLAVDTDPQRNASHVLIGQGGDEPTLFDLLLGRTEPEQAIVPTKFPNVDVVPSAANLADATAVLHGELGRERRLRVALQAVESRYDFVLIDTAPTRSILTVNVLNYAREVIVPFAPGLFGFLGLGQLQKDVEQIRTYLDNAELTIAGVVLTMTERNNVHADLEAHLRGQLGALVMSTKIPRNIKVEEAHARHQSVLEYAPKSPGAVAYAALAREIKDGRAQDRNDAADRNPESNSATGDAA